MKTECCEVAGYSVSSEQCPVVTHRPNVRVDYGLNISNGADADYRDLHDTVIISTHSVVCVQMNQQTHPPSQTITLLTLISIHIFMQTVTATGTYRKQNVYIRPKCYN